MVTAREMSKGFRNLDERCTMDVLPRRQSGADAGSVSITLNHREGTGWQSQMKWK